MQRNFTDAEVTYCRAQSDPAASFAARWAGKEAVFKALGVASKGAGAAMRDIEILPDNAGVPQVTLHGAAQDAAQGKNITTVHVSLSHSEVSCCLRQHNLLGLMSSPRPLLLLSPLRNLRSALRLIRCHVSFTSCLTLCTIPKQ